MDFLRVESGYLNKAAITAGIISDDLSMQDLWMRLRGQLFLPLIQGRVYLLSRNMHSILVSNKVFSCLIYFLGIKIAHSLVQLFLGRLNLWKFVKRSLVHGWIRLLCLVK